MSRQAWPCPEPPPEKGDHHSLAKGTVRFLTPWLRVSHEGVLAVLLALEIALFSVLGTNFLSTENAFEVLRLSVEIGLLSLAMTPVIVTGGIDLSAGSLLGLWRAKRTAGSKRYKPALMAHTRSTRRSPCRSARRIR